MLFSREHGEKSQAGDRREVVLEAAVRIIGAGGPDAITHRAVAARAGVPLGSVSYYFNSREELVRESFRYYLASAVQFFESLERQARPGSARSLTELLVDVARREFMEPELVRAEYELILYAAQDEALAREFAAYERSLEVQLAARLERLGATRPIDASRTLIDLVRGFELERFTRPDADFDDLRRRLLPVVTALTRAGKTGSAAHGDLADRAAKRRTSASPLNDRLTTRKRRTR